MKEFYDKTYIVTGGLGFIGSNVIKMLNDNGATKIYIIDDYNLNNDSFKNITNLKFIDIIDKNTFNQVIAGEKYIGGEVIIHMGADTDTTNDNGAYLMDNNYLTSIGLLSYAKQNKLRFIYASSAAVYGNNNTFIEDPINETPLNKYAFTKYMFDQYVRRKFFDNENHYNDINKISITGLRFFNVYGIQENHKGKMASYFNQIYNKVINDDRPVLFENSEDIFRDFVYVKDVVNVIKHFINNDIDGIFNVGSGEARSFEAVFQIFKELHNYSHYPTVIPIPENLKNQYQYYTKADLTNLRKVGGYKEGFTTLEDGLTEYYHFLKNYNGYFDKSMKIYD